MKTKILLFLTQNQNSMKKQIILFAILLGFVSANAQNNPFAELGYEPKIATLSNGQFNESFDNDTIVQIGSVMFNTKSKQIVAFVEIDTMYSEATLEPDIVSRWISPDPLADHPMQIGKSPYQYAWNNPVYWTDPDGQCPFCPWLDAVVDVGFIIYDVGVLGYDYATTGTTQGEDWAALSADVLSIAVPMTVGAGLAARATYKAAKTIDKANDIKKATLKANKAMGKQGEKTVTKSLKNEFKGDNVLEQVTGKFEDGKRTVFDNVVVNKKTGKVNLVNETKTGNASLSKNQKRYHSNGESATLTGKNAGNTKGQTVNTGNTNTRVTRVKKEDL